MTDNIPFGYVLSSLARTAARDDVDMVLVGATARDVMLAHEGQARARRATEDVDIAVAVTGYDGFRAVTSGLEPVPGTEHKFRVDGVEVDVVPFGDIESDERTVAWPDGFVMNTLGLAEAFASALVIDLGGGLTMRVATLSAQAALKTFAWADRSSVTARDAADLGTIIEAYSAGDRIDTLFEPDNEPILARHNFDITLAGAFILGRDVRDTMGGRVADAAAAIVHADLDEDIRLPAALRLQYPDPEALLRSFAAGLVAD